jgi:hypothetical protein
VAELTSALQASRAGEHGSRGELARTEATRADAERRAAEQTALAAAHARELEQARHQSAVDTERMGKLQAEVARLVPLEAAAQEVVRLRKEIPALKELVQQRTQAAEAASRTAQASAAERTRLAERLSIDTGSLQSEVQRLEGELAQSRRRQVDAEAQSEALGAELARERQTGELARSGASQAQAQAAQQASAELARERQALNQARAVAVAAQGALAEAEKRHVAETTRLRGTLADLEKHLETRARVELQLKRKVQEAEQALAKARAAPVAAAAAAAPPGQLVAMQAEIAAQQARVAGLEQELEDLRGENDFLNGEVARYTQKNRDLTGRLGGKG